jgi:hypothetical protein
VLVAGTFDTDATFGPGEPGETVLTTDSGTRSFVARYDGHGALIWARSIDLGYSAAVRSLAGLADGSSLLTGTFLGVVTFGAGEAGETALVSAGGHDVFVARMSP